MQKRIYLVVVALKIALKKFVEYTCPPDSLIFFTRNEDGINGILNVLDDKVAQGCNKIKRLMLTRHGSPGRHGDVLNRNNVGGLKPYSCLMADNPIVDLTGCNAGKGCSGKLFMQRTAEALFHNTKGTVISPNQTVAVIFPGDDSGRIHRKRERLFGLDHDIEKHSKGDVYTEQSFGYNSLTYTPSSPPQATWEKLDDGGNYKDTIMESLIDSKPDEYATLKDACIGEITKLANAIDNETKAHKDRKTCKPLLECDPPPYRGTTIMARSTANSLRRSNYWFSKAANYYDSLLTIKYKLKRCDCVYGIELGTEFGCSRYAQRPNGCYNCAGHNGRSCVRCKLLAVILTTIFCLLLVDNRELQIAGNKDKGCVNTTKGDLKC